MDVETKSELYIPRKCVSKTLLSQNSPMASPFNFKCSTAMLKTGFSCKDPAAYACVKHNPHSSKERVFHVRKKFFVASFVEKIEIFSYINNVKTTKF